MSDVNDGCPNVNLNKMYNVCREYDAVDFDSFPVVNGISCGCMMFISCNGHGCKNDERMMYYGESVDARRSFVKTLEYKGWVRWRRRHYNQDMTDEWAFKFDTGWSCPDCMEGMLFRAWQILCEVV